MTKRIHKLDILEYVFCFISVFLILGTLFVVKGYAPFGENSLAWMDGSIQYLDFFSYFKDVLSGNNNIGYSFSKTLGGTNIAIFSYYLSSPFSLLVIFFEKTDMSSFFDVVVLLKLCVASMTMHYFITRTAIYSKDNNKNRFISCLLSICYALSQYSIAQASNIMWLDGVYLLPLIIYGVHKVARGERNTFLSITVALSILFNWYSGGINCMLSIFFYIFEIIYVRIVENTKLTLKEYMKKTFLYLLGMLVGVLLSCVLFLPTIAALQNSTRGSVNLSSLIDSSFIGSVSGVIQGFSIGGTSYGTTENVNIRASLFCGTITMIGCFGLFLDRKVSMKQKLYFATIIILSVLFLYWQPFFTLFSLLKDANSYWIRYSYVVIFTLIWIASQYYLNKNEHSFYAISLAGFIYAIAMVFLNYRNPEQDITLVNITAICMCVMGILVSIFINNDKKKVIHALSCLALSIVLLFELYTNARFLMQTYHSDDAITYQEYSDNETKQINKIIEQDEGIYRVSQTSTRNMSEDRLTANYDEAFAYNYWSISGYTSSPDDNQRELLERLGYRKNGENFNVVNTSIITTDSLLGVKYVLSDMNIDAYTVFDEESLNNKIVYENQYVLPMAFTYQSSSTFINYTNPFQYQNELYSELLGREVQLYIPVSYLLEKDNNTWVYQLQKLEGNYVYYGNLPWENLYKTQLNISNTYTIGYSCWQSPSVFYIPNNSENEKLSIIASGDEITFIEGKEQFYALDLDLLEEVSKELQSREADSISIENGKVEIMVDANEGDSLYLSIPYDKGWTIYVNGEEVTADLFADCLYSIPLENGNNEVVMKYKVNYLTLGISASLIGIGLLFIQVYLENRRKKIEI